MNIAIEKGMSFQTNNSGQCTVIDYVNFKNVTVIFSDGTVIKCRGDHLRVGKVKNPNTPSVLGIGYIGVGPHLATIKGKNTRIYQKWVNMLTRCYCEKLRHKNKTYEHCTVAESWHCFQNFAEWASKQVGSDEPTWHLDKDILVTGNKVYSPQTCCFVPQQVNNLFTHIKSNGNTFVGVGYEKRRRKYRAWCHDSFGDNRLLGDFNTEKDAFEVYCKFKESVIQKVAYEWEGVIADDVFNALLKYEVKQHV